jgi:hypothetical protein
VCVQKKMDTLLRLVSFYWVKSHIRHHAQLHEEWLDSWPYLLRISISEALSEDLELGLLRLNSLEYRRNYEDIQGEARRRCYTRWDMVTFILTVFLAIFFFSLLFYGIVSLAESSTSHKDSFYHRPGRRGIDRIRT